MSGKSFSIVEYYGCQSGSKCGYCKGHNGSLSTGMWGHFLTTTDYQNLIDRGWRRSGLYCYKPTMNLTCCPQYTIKCDAVNFKLNKSHKKILKRMTKFLQDGVKDKASDDICSNDMTLSHSDVGMADLPSAPATSRVKIDGNAGIKCAKSPDEPVVVEETANEANNTILVERDVGSLPKNSQMSGPDPSKPVCKKAKVLRLERRKQKLLATGRPVDQAMPSKNVEKTLEDFLNEAPTENCAHKLKVKLVPSSSGVSNEVIALYRKYQVQVHNDPPSRVTSESFERFLCRSPLQIKLLLVNSDEFNSTKQCEYVLYKKYQKIIHDDEPKNISEFMNFLVETPLQANKDSNGPPSGYGSFHQQYWLDDKLIAVAVLDILPKCISSVYFFYDPDFRFLSLGTYGSLREIAFTRELQRKCPELSNYYMGFYIHSCPKMRYKGRLAPSYLLCPEVYTWHLLDEAVASRLDTSKYSRLNQNGNAKDADAPSLSDIDAVLIFYDREWMRYETYKELTDEDFDTVHEYARLVGRKCFTKMLLYRGD